MPLESIPLLQMPYVSSYVPLPKMSYQFLSALPSTQVPLPRAKKTCFIFNLGYGNKLLIDLPAPSSPPGYLAYLKIIQQFHHITALQGTPSLSNTTVLWV